MASFHDHADRARRSLLAGTIRWCSSLILKWLPSQGYTLFATNPVESIRDDPALPRARSGGAPYLIRVIRSIVIEIAMTARRRGRAPLSAPRHHPNLLQTSRSSACSSERCLPVLWRLRPFQLAGHVDLHRRSDGARLRDAHRLIRSRVIFAVVNPIAEIAGGPDPRIRLN
jgi:hypothetical protein